MIDRADKPGGGGTGFPGNYWPGQRRRGRARLAGLPRRTLNPSLMGGSKEWPFRAAQCVVQTPGCGSRKATFVLLCCWLCLRWPVRRKKAGKRGQPQLLPHLMEGCWAPLLGGHPPNKSALWGGPASLVRGPQVADAHATTAAATGQVKNIWVRVGWLAPHRSRLAGSNRNVALFLTGR